MTGRFGKKVAQHPVTLGKNQTSKLLSIAVHLGFKFDYWNPGYNILELSNVLVHVQFATSKARLDI